MKLAKFTYATLGLPLVFSALGLEIVYFGKVIFCFLTVFYGIFQIPTMNFSHLTFRCNVCWKRLPTQDDLTVHMAQHGNPRYRCHICDEQFHRKYLFDNHFLLQHATPEDLEISKKEVIYDTLLELANQSS